MRIRYQNIKGLEVLANKEGRLLGSIRKLQLDSKKKTTLGLVFKGKLMSQEHWAKVASVERIGEDVLFLSNMKAVREDEPPGRDLKDMLGLPVNTMDGKRLGSLEDVLIDIENWKVSGIVLDNGGAVDLGAEAVLGEDTILLQSGAAEQVGEAPADQSGFLARVFQNEGDAPRTKAKRARAGARSRAKSKKRS